MTRLRALLVSLVAAALVLSACGSADPDEADTTTSADTSTSADPDDRGSTSSESSTATADAADTATEAGTASGEQTNAQPDGDSEPADTAIPAMTPEEQASQTVLALFNILPDDDQAACVVAESAGLPGLADALTSQINMFAQYEDQQLQDISYGINRCIDGVALGGWATDAVNPAGDVRETAPACFGERFDGEGGDQLFHTFVALSFQRRYDPAAVEPMVDTFATCTPVTALAQFFADQAENEADFTIEVDRDCLAEALADPEASRTFWQALIDGLGPPNASLQPWIDSCATPADASAPDGAVDDRAAAVPADFVPWSGTGALAGVVPAARVGIYGSPPPMTIDPNGSYEAVFATGGGQIRIRLLTETAPMTVNNFVNLARDGFYDGTIFHRVLDEFMAQGGDPTGTGTGGPGYQFGDEVDDGPPLDRPGLLAMANSGPNTNGSQFFITFVPTEWLTGNHTVFGEVVEGQDIVDAIERRDPGGNSPGQVLESVVIVEG